MIIALTIAGSLLVVALFLSLYRLGAGPSPMDRALSLDVVTAASIGLVVVVMSMTGRIDLLPLLVVLSLVGFIGSTTIARFNSRDTAEDSRLLSEEEVRALLVQEERERDDELGIDPDEVA